MKKIIVILILVLTLALFLTVPVVAAENQIQKGDILLFGRPAVEPDHEHYFMFSYLSFWQAAAKKTVYSPLWGEDISTWDDSNFPMGERYYWIHVEIATEDSFKPACLENMEEEDIVIILRSTAYMKEVVNIDITCSVFQELLERHTGYNQSFFEIWLKWIHWTIDNIEYVKPWKWKEMNGIDIESYPIPAEMQYSPYLGTSFYTDIASMEFMERDGNCSSITAWALFIAWYRTSQENAVREAIRNIFKNNIPAVAAVDAIAPGGLAWWLYENNLVEIIPF